MEDVSEERRKRDGRSSTVGLARGVDAGTMYDIERRNNRRADTNLFSRSPSIFLFKQLTNKILHKQASKTIDEITLADSSAFLIPSFLLVFVGETATVGFSLLRFILKRKFATLFRQPHTDYGGRSDISPGLGKNQIRYCESGTW